MDADDLKHLAHVLGHHIVALANQCAGARHASERDDATGAHAQLNKVVIAGLLAQAHDIIQHRVGNLYIAQVVLDIEQVIAGNHGLDVVERVGIATGLEDIDLVLARRIANGQANHKAVELAIGQRLSARRAHRVLGCDTHEGTRDLMRLPINRHRAFFHNLEQGRLRLCAGTVDLVAQQHVAVDGAPHKAKHAGVAVEHRKARNVRGQRIGRKLHALKVQTQCTRKSQSQRRLAGTGHILQQDVAAGIDGHESFLDHIALAQQGAAHFVDDAVGLFDNHGYSFPR